MITSDLALLERWVAHRDAAAFAELVRRHASMVYATCRRVLSSEAGADDVAQECFAEVAQLASTSRVEASLGGWLHTVATRRSLDRLRAEGRRRAREARYAAESAAHAPSYPDDVQPHLDAAIAALPEKLRLPVVAHFLEGKAHQEIADALGLPRTTVTSRVAKGIEEVRRHLKKRGVVIGASALASVLTVESAQAAPPALVAALGKMALLGKGAMPAAHVLSHTSTLATIGGAVMSAKKVLIVVALVAVLTGDYFLTRNYIVPQSTEGERTEVASGPSSSRSAHGSATKSSMGVTSDSDTSKPAGRPAASPGDIKEESDLVDKSGAIGTIAGIVEDAQGVGVVGAEVKAWRDGMKADATASTSGDGKFVLSGLTGDSYTVLASKLGSGFGKLDGVGLGADKVVIRLVASATIGGRVYDAETGAGIEGVNVMPVSEGAAGGRLEMISLAACQQQKTDRDGRYSLDVPAPGSYRMMPMETGDYEQPQRPEDCPRATVKEGKVCDGVDVPLRLGSAISGTIFDAAGTALADAEVALIDKVRRGSGAASTIKTGPDGSYVFRGLASSWTYAVRATYTGYAPADSEAITLEGAQRVEGVDLYLGTGKTVRGRVVLTSGEGVGGVDVMLMSGTEGDFVAIPNLAATTNDEGRFEIANVSAGTYRSRVVVAKGRGGDTVVEGTAFTVPADGEAAEVEILIGPGLDGFISGRVTDESGTPLPDTSVGAHSASGRGWAATDENGYYRIEGLGFADLYMMELLEGNGYTWEMRADVPVNSEGVDFVRTKGGTVSGTVIDGSTGQPIPEFEVGEMPRLLKTSSATGSFSVSQIRGTEVTIHARAEGYTTASSEPLTLKPGEAVSGIVITLWPGEGVTGVVVDAATGASVQGARVAAFDGSLNAEMLIRGFMWGQNDPVTDHEGRFLLEGISAGEPVNLVAWHAGYAPSVVLGSLEGEVIFGLSRGGSIAGTVYEGDEPVANVVILVRKTEPYVYEVCAHSQLSGAYAVENLPPGPYSLRCQKELSNDARTLWEETVQVIDGVKTEVSPQLEAKAE